MLYDIRAYLNDVRTHLHLDPLTEKRVIGELYTYFQEKIAELRERGASETQAANEAIKSFGGARSVARLMYEAHSRGTWYEAAITSLPHFLIASLFATHLWRNPVLVVLISMLFVGVTLFGWWHSRPNWLFSWVGYSLFPLMIGGYLSYPTLEQTVLFLLGRQGSLPTIWALLVTCTLFGSSLWIIISTTIRVVKRDWLLASLMLVPIPVLASWFFNIDQVGGLFRNTEALYQWDVAMVSVLLLLGIASATFIRLRRRLLKIGALITIGSISLVMLGDNLWGDLGFTGMFVISLSMLVFLLIPAMLEARLGHGEPEEDAWFDDWVEHPSMARR
ncbi:MAG: hypothetical protein HY665_09860 [Chloroflexi bacterium]|nr:hypothetical protein [Chloroflexota bacterium]